MKGCGRVLDGSATTTSCSGFLTGNGRTSSLSTSEKMAVLAPIPNAKRDDGDCGKARTLSKRPQSVTNVGGELFDKRQALPIPVVFLYRFHRAELENGLTARLIG